MQQKVKDYKIVLTSPPIQLGRNLRFIPGIRKNTMCNFLWPGFLISISIRCVAFL